MFHQILYCLSNCWCNFQVWKKFCNLVGQFFIVDGLLELKKWEAFFFSKIVGAHSLTLLRKTFVASACIVGKYVVSFTD